MATRESCRSFQLALSTCQSEDGKVKRRQAGANHSLRKIGQHSTLALRVPTKWPLPYRSGLV